MPSSTPGGRLQPGARQARLILVVLVAAVVASWFLVNRSGVAVSTAGLMHRVGVYAITTPADASALRTAGGDTVLTPWPQPDSAMGLAIRHANLGIVDSWPEQLLYATICHDGPASCRRPPPGVVDSMIRKIERHVSAATTSGEILGYYVVDDNWTNLRWILPRVRAAIRNAAPHAPSVCGFYLVLPLAGEHDRTRPVHSSRFARSLRNYSPRWCDSVLLYAYAPGFSRPTHVPVDWSMGAAITTAKRALQARGWQARSEPLIGTPQAFGFHPGISRDGTRVYRDPPTSAQLSVQIAAFCRAGAESILAYTWRDGNPGSTTEMGTSADLRAGFVRGISTCRKEYWSGS